MWGSFPPEESTCERRKAEGVGCLWKRGRQLILKLRHGCDPKWKSERLAVVDNASGGTWLKVAIFMWKRGHAPPPRSANRRRAAVGGGSCGSGGMTRSWRSTGKRRTAA